jgi:hypothetical protein
MSASPGTRFGPYEIIKPLGAGGMGEVYEARDTRLDRPVAIKVLPAQLAGDAAARARFDREARAIAALNHPNICALHDVGDANGHGFLVMERLDGETLQDRLQRGALDIEQTIDYGIALADALDAAHSRGLIHRDLKPANIFITTRGVVKILDFGLAKSVLESEADVTRSINESLTVTGTTLGTVAYMSPEQLRGEPLDVRTDLFSFGLVLYEMATGERAFGGSTVVVAAAGILSQQPPAPRTLRPDLPESLELVILKALEKDRAIRFQSAAELRSDLTQVKRGAMPSVMRTAEVVAPRAVPPPIPTQAQHVPSFVPAAVAPAGPAPEAARRSPRARWRRLAVVLLFVLVVGTRDRWMDWMRPGRERPVPAAAQETSSVPSGQPLVEPPPGPALDTRPPRPGAPPPTDPTPDVPSVEGIDKAVNDALAEVTKAVAPLAGRGLRDRIGRGFGPGGATLVRMLRNVPPETYDLVYASNDVDAMLMAQQLKGALTTAGWTNASTTETTDSIPKLGISAAQVTPGVAALTKWAIGSGHSPDVRRVPSLPRPRIVIGKQE